MISELIKLKIVLFILFAFLYAFFALAFLIVFLTGTPFCVTFEDGFLGYNFLLTVFLMQVLFAFLLYVFVKGMS
jgi:hypothetical protein